MVEKLPTSVLQAHHVYTWSLGVTSITKDSFLCTSVFEALIIHSPTQREPMEVDAGVNHLWLSTGD